MAMAPTAFASCMVVELITDEEGFARRGDEAAPIIYYRYIAMIIIDLYQLKLSIVAKVLSFHSSTLEDTIHTIPTGKGELCM